MSAAIIDASLADLLELAGASGDQVDRTPRASPLAAEFPVGASYTPGDVLGDFPARRG